MAKRKAKKPAPKPEPMPRSSKVTLDQIFNQDIMVSLLHRATTHESADVRIAHVGALLGIFRALIATADFELARLGVFDEQA